MNTRLMKNYVATLFLVIIAFVSFSCDKEDERPDYFYSFQVDGVEKSFKANQNANIVFIDDRQNNARIAFWTMVTGTNTQRNTLVISLRTIERLELGLNYEMQVPIVVQNTTVPSITMVYFDENGKEWGATLLQSLHPGAQDNASVRLTEFTTEGSSGVFQGVLVDMQDTRPIEQRRTIQLSNGRFFLPNFVENR
jgi:hypothetical protein